MAHMANIDTVHSFEDAIEFCLAITEDTKTLKQARKKINDVLCLVHESKFEKIKCEFGVFDEKPEQSIRVRVT